jgi:hypothetical protein
VKRIDVLPDDALLEIFDFYTIINLPYGDKTRVEAWQSLVHVCQRWRGLVLESRCRLNLQLYCSPKTPARDKLDVWPALPLIVGGNMLSSGTDNVIAALGQTNRVCKVNLWRLADRQLETVLAAMQVPFPELTDLWLERYSNREVPVFPDSFLDGSAPRLRSFALQGIPFPGLPKLLLSATHIVYLTLYDIPHSGYISPKAMIALVSMLPSLGSLTLQFRSPQSRPDSESPSLPPLKRSVLPALTSLHFKGVTEYLEKLVIGIDTPQLDFSSITFFNQIDFDTPRLAQFINCTPTLRALDEAHVRFDDDFAHIELSASSQTPILRISISCREPDWQLSSIEQVCNFSLDHLSVEDFYIEHQYWRTVWKNDAIENTLWLQLLLPFTAVKNLYLSKEFAPGIVATLQELVGGRMTEVLPSLQNIFVEGLEPSGAFQENIGRFVAARRLSGHPIAISDWDKDPLVYTIPVSDAGSERTGSFVTEGSDSDDEEDAENDMVAPFAHRDAPAGPSNSTTLSDTTQPGSKSDPDRATEGTSALGSSIGRSVDSGGGAAGALPERGLGPERGPTPPRTRRWSRW